MQEVKGTAFKQRELQPWEKPLSPPRPVPKPVSTKKKGRFSPKEKTE